MQQWKQTRYLVVLGLLIIIAIATMSAIIDTKRFEANLVEQTSGQMLAVARSESISIGSFLNDVLDDLRAMAQDQNIINVLRKGSPPLSGPDDSRFLAFNIVAIRHAARTTTFHMLDRNGFVVACYPYDEAYMNKDYSVEVDILYAMDNQRPYISEPFMLDETKEIVFSMTVPVFDGKEFVGLLRRVIPLSTLKMNVQGAEDAMKDTKMHAYIISEKGHLLYGSWAGLAEQNPVTAVVGASGNYDKFVDSMKMGEERYEIDESAGYSGGTGPEKVIIAFAPIRVGTQSWSVGVAMPYKAVSKPIVAHSRMVLIFTCMILIGLIASAIVFYRIQQRHYAVQMERQAERTRVMLESLGAACHHLGQPATLLLLNLGIVHDRMKTDDAQLSQLVKESLEAVENLSETLHKLNAVNEYKTTQYLAHPEGKDKDHRILDI
jgi:hypothetical protein